VAITNKLSSSILPLSPCSSLPASSSVSRPVPGVNGSVLPLSDRYEYEHQVFPVPVEESDHRPGYPAVPCSHSRDVPRVRFAAPPGLEQAATALSGRSRFRSSTNNGSAGRERPEHSVQKGRIVYGDATDTSLPALAYGPTRERRPGELGVRLLPERTHACVAQAR